MTREEFKKLADKGFVILDGGTGTNLQNAGMPVGICPEEWILDNPDVLINLQREFIDAGADIVYAPTFTGNRIKLDEYGLADRLVEINTSLVKLSKKAVGDKAYVAGDLTMTGRQLYPLGTLTFDELVDVYKEQAKAIADAGADLFVVETMMSLQETRAAVIAIREICDLPIMATLTFETDGRTLFGTPAECVPTVLQSLGADAVGINCGAGPDKMTDIVKKLVEYSNVPVIVKANAGLPELENGVTVYKMQPEEFAEKSAQLAQLGAGILGGCCGTTPEHIRALKKVLETTPKKPTDHKKERVICSERKAVKIVPGERFLVIGERINPTGKKALQAELREGKLDIVRKFAREQEKAGAAILDVNCGTNGIDEKQTMINVVNELSQISDLPLCIDSSYPEVIEAALRIYPGRALINSINYEAAKFEPMLETAKKYGAMFIFLPIDDEGIPGDITQKHKIVDEAIDRALEKGFTKEDIVVDALVGTVGADKGAALSCFSTFDYCKAKGLATVCGLSNISFGLPERSFVNTAFLAMSIASGLTMAIANPSQDLLMNTAAAGDMLLNREGSDIRYIDRINYYTEKLASEPTAVKTASAPAVKQDSTPKDKNEYDPIFKAVLGGEKDSIVALTKERVEGGTTPSDIINTLLIPAINKVGKLFEQKRYFLPQLIASANTMEMSIGYLEPLLGGDAADENAPVIIIATVEGDVHDIGKNLVALMLKNYGYRVIDLGKNVESEVIVDTAIKENAAVIALSALMTTTMMNMKTVIGIAKDKGCNAKIIVGGAAVTESFAEEIGADGYSGDAADCVRLVERLLAAND
ncbi:MAG: homocysteine S-methyltransferase family protein [Ruminococcus sp.]|nr:homocysteine S-methyltransferase family protein [Ruminococcus sp.]